MSSLFRDNDQTSATIARITAFRQRSVLLFNDCSMKFTVIVSLEYCRGSLASCLSSFLFTQLQSVCITSSQVSAIPDTHVLEKSDYNTYALRNATQEHILLIKGSDNTTFPQLFFSTPFDRNTS